MNSNESSQLSTPSVIDNPIVSTKEIPENHYRIDLSLIKAISLTIECLIKENNVNIEKIINSTKNIFHYYSTPDISIHDYIVRIAKYTEINPSTLILSLIYIDRFCDYNNIALTNYNIHRIFFSSILVSIKFNEDNVFKLKYYANVAGLTVHELRKLEYYFYKNINGMLYVDKVQFEKYQNYLLHYFVKD